MSSKQVLWQLATAILSLSALASLAVVLYVKLLRIGASFSYCDNIFYGVYYFVLIVYCLNAFDFVQVKVSDQCTHTQREVRPDCIR